MSSIWTPVWRNPNRATMASEATLSGAVEAAEARDAVLASRPIEQGADDLGGDALAPVGRLDAVADLDPAIRVGRRVEPDASR